MNNINIQEGYSSHYEPNNYFVLCSCHFWLSLNQARTTKLKFQSQKKYDIFQSIFKESQLIVFTKCLTSVQKTTPTISPHTHTKKKQTKYLCLFRSRRFEAVVLVSGTKIVGRIFRFDRSTLPPSWDVERGRLVDFFPLKKTIPKKAI